MELYKIKFKLYTLKNNTINDIDYLVIRPNKSGNNTIIAHCNNIFIDVIENEHEILPSIFQEGDTLIFDKDLVLVDTEYGPEIMIISPYFGGDISSIIVLGSSYTETILSKNIDDTNLILVCFSELGIDLGDNHNNLRKAVELYHDLDKKVKNNYDIESCINKAINSIL